MCDLDLETEISVFLPDLPCSCLILPTGQAERTQPTQPVDYPTYLVGYISTRQATRQATFLPGRLPVGYICYDFYPVEIQPTRAYRVEMEPTHPTRGVSKLACSCLTLHLVVCWPPNSKICCCWDDNFFWDSHLVFQKTHLFLASNCLNCPDNALMVICSLQKDSVVQKFVGVQQEKRVPKLFCQSQIYRKSRERAPKLRINQPLDN